MRDGAGVRIVESRAAAWRAGQQWRVDPQPSLEIRQADGDPLYQFFRISGVDLLPDGGVVVLDGGSAQLRRYGPDRRHLWSAGGRGGGPFATAALRALAGERLVTAAGDVPEVRIHGPDGRFMARYTVTREPVATSPAEARRLVDYWVEQRYHGAPSTIWNEWLDRMPIPARRPAYDRLRVSASGHIWARRYLLESDRAATPTWDVFAPGGEYLGTIGTPPGLEITTILDSAIAGVFRDSLDVEHVRVHRLSVGPPGAVR